MKKRVVAFLLGSVVFHFQAAEQALALLQAAKDHGPYYAYHAVHHTFGPLAVGVDKMKDDILQPNSLTRLVPSVKPVYVNAAAAFFALYVAAEYVPWHKIAMSGGTTLYTTGVQEIMNQSKHYKKRWGATDASLKFPLFFLVQTFLWRR